MLDLCRTLSIQASRQEVQHCKGMAEKPTVGIQCPASWIQTSAPFLSTMTQALFCSVSHFPASHYSPSFHQTFFKIAQWLLHSFSYFQVHLLNHLWVQVMLCTPLCYTCTLPCQHYLPVRSFPVLSEHKLSAFNSIILLLISHNLSHTAELHLK